MAKNRSKVSERKEEIAPAARDLFAATEPDRKKEQERQRQRNRQAKRAVYDLTEGLKTAVTRRSVRLGIPASQLAQFLLSDSLRRFDAGEIDPSPYLTPSESPRFRNNLEIDDDWYYEGEH